jgi:DNA-binding NarL/FixJ family response regulator
VPVDLGTALRHRGHPIEARSVLAGGLDGASACGALRLAARARAERASSARPRREHLSGPEALTSSERRVAELAAQGFTNGQIAQALFVTAKTVELHLGCVFPKLGISRRGRRSAAIGDD